MTGVTSVRNGSASSAFRLWSEVEGRGEGWVHVTFLRTKPSSQKSPDVEYLQLTASTRTLHSRLCPLCVILSLSYTFIRTSLRP